MFSCSFLSPGSRAKRFSNTRKRRTRARLAVRIGPFRNKYSSKFGHRGSSKTKDVERRRTRLASPPAAACFKGPNMQPAWRTCWAGSLTLAGEGCDIISLVLPSLSAANCAVSSTTWHWFYGWQFKAQNHCRLINFKAPKTQNTYWKNCALFCKLFFL